MDAKIKIGDKAHGGIVFYVDDTGQHGLVCSLYDQKRSANWKNAKKICDSYSGSGFSDWYLPTIHDLGLMYENLHKKADGGFANFFYWSSTEQDFDVAWVLNFGNDVEAYFKKVNDYRVRAIRAF